jgi:hypothetical protein
MNTTSKPEWHCTGTWFIGLHLDFCPEVQETARVLAGPNRAAYETLRAELIELFGYNTFRDLQAQAFKVALYGDIFDTKR